MSDTLANFISKIRVDLDERTATYYTDADLTNWINEGARELARRAEVGQAKSTSVTVTTASSTQPPPPRHRSTRCNSAPTTRWTKSGGGPNPRPATIRRPSCSGGSP